MTFFGNFCFCFLFCATPALQAWGDPTQSDPGHPGPRPGKTLVHHIGLWLCHATLPVSGVACSLFLKQEKSTKWVEEILSWLGWNQLLPEGTRHWFHQNQSTKKLSTGDHSQLSTRRMKRCLSRPRLRLTSFREVWLGWAVVKSAIWHQNNVKAPSWNANCYFRKWEFMWFIVQRASYNWKCAGCILFWLCLLWLGILQFFFHCNCLIASNVGVAGYFLTLWHYQHFRKTKYFRQILYTSHRFALCSRRFAHRASTPWVWFPVHSFKQSNSFPEGIDTRPISYPPCNYGKTWLGTFFQRFGQLFQAPPETDISQSPTSSSFSWVQWSVVSI